MVGWLGGFSFQNMIDTDTAQCKLLLNYYRQYRIWQLKDKYTWMFNKGNNAI